VLTRAPPVPGRTGRRPAASSSTAYAPLERLQRTAGNRAMLRLLGKEAPRSLQRDPKGPVRMRTKVPADPAPSGPSLVAADWVSELKREDETWHMTVEGDFVPESLGGLLWPGRGLPKDVSVVLKVGITEPIGRSWFELKGLQPYHLRTMEPSMAKLFADHGLAEDAPDSARLKEARTAFHNRHIDHATQVLVNIDQALERITKRNPELRTAFYEHYANHKLADHDSWSDGIDFTAAKNAGATNRGDTVINPKVLDLTSVFATSDPLSLLAGTLIHEFVHTPQGGGSDPVSSAPNEAKAYGVELFFSERMGDQKRMDRILDMGWETDPVNRSTGSNKVFSKTYDTMRALYKLIDNGGASAAAARKLSVEFITSNEDDYGPALKAFIAKLP
jgi:hypothetical protein